MQLPDMQLFFLAVFLSLFLLIIIVFEIWYTILHFSAKELPKSFLNLFQDSS